VRGEHKERHLSVPRYLGWSAAGAPDTAQQVAHLMRGGPAGEEGRNRPGLWLKYLQRTRIRLSAGALALYNPLNAS
jgi:hypothetical protein